MFCTQVPNQRALPTLTLATSFRKGLGTYMGQKLGPSVTNRDSATIVQPLARPQVLGPRSQAPDMAMWCLLLQAMLLGLLGAPGADREDGYMTSGCV